MLRRLLRQTSDLAAGRWRRWTCGVERLLDQPRRGLRTIGQQPVRRPLGDCKPSGLSAPHPPTCWDRGKSRCLSRRRPRLQTDLGACFFTAAGSAGSSSATLAAAGWRRRVRRRVGRPRRAARRPAALAFAVPAALRRPVRAADAGESAPCTSSAGTCGSAASTASMASAASASRLPSSRWR